jgi:hypothetical protein
MAHLYLLNQPGVAFLLPHCSYFLCDDLLEKSFGCSAWAGSVVGALRTGGERAGVGVMAAKESRWWVEGLGSREGSYGNHVE